MALPLLLATVLIAADQALKFWAFTHLQEHQPPIPFITGLVEWVLTFNTGAAWSMFSGSALPLSIGRFVIGIGILAYLVFKPQPRYLSIILAIIAAGAIGNAIDGIRLGKVTDMIYSPLLSIFTRAIGKGSFPIFNIADSCVVIGTILLLITSFVLDEKRKKKTI